ncbi:MAG: DsrE family protein [Candidatus Rokubacteria bacterium]|nr:DsrE family protein [Candidatus Rokubacteria bacterium]
MSRYVLIESKSPLDGGEYAFDLAKQLREQRHDVTVYLVQDAVFAARRGFKRGEALLAEAKRHDLKLLADEVSLRQRGVAGERLSPDVRASSMGSLVDLLMEQSDKVIWH